ncbi:hypothetical protein [Iningainema tapete]|uniref:FTP domain-containing protein n=1 Tax=Iningainema tapete BLCC-T55 TaxID=2748662 RepID=A0A8J6XW24_9CYAN|nr:hypothetical protein [Iningainema tapete]MBD2774598.1 hypothetical protein [Iningainema tapete BLCC-T55]
MRTFTFHAEDETPLSKRNGIDELAAALERAKSDQKDLGQRFKEVGEKLMEVLEVEPPRSFVARKPPAHESQLESVGIETWRRAKTHTIKFRQKYKNIPVYGASVTVEVDENYDLLAINSAIGDPGGVDASPKLIPDNLKDVIQQQTKHNLHFADLQPHLYYYFDSIDDRWRLVYLVENKLNQTNAIPKFESIPKMVDYVIDAHTGDLVRELPRVKTTR